MLGLVVPEEMARAAEHGTDTALGIKVAKGWDSQRQIPEILELQRKYLKRNVSAEEAEQEGFLTAEYTVEFMQEMWDHHPPIVAVDAATGRVVGYTLVGTKAIREKHPLLKDLFDTLDRSPWQGRPLADRNYVICSQLCVAKEHRKHGLAVRLYQTFRECLASDFECVATDVASANIASIKAHLRAGFEIFGTLTYGGITWEMVVWNWR